MSKATRDRILLAIIPILAVVLLVILFRPADEPVPAALLSSPATPGVKQPTLGLPKSSRQSARPEVRLEELLAFNPFEPQSPRPAAADSSQASPGSAAAAGTELPAVRVQAVYHDGQEIAAIVNSKIVRNGDYLENFGRVVEITASGLVIEKD